MNLAQGRSKKSKFQQTNKTMRADVQAEQASRMHSPVPYAGIRKG